MSITQGHVCLQHDHMHIGGNLQLIVLWATIYIRTLHKHRYNLKIGSSRPCHIYRPSLVQCALFYRVTLCGRIPHKMRIGRPM
jgi:hypothetical protein